MLGLLTLLVEILIGMIAGLLHSIGLLVSVLAFLTITCLYVVFSEWEKPEEWQSKSFIYYQILDYAGDYIKMFSPIIIGYVLVSIFS